MRITPATAKVLNALLAQPATARYGMELMQATGLPSGSLYPLLARLTRAGWLAQEPETIDPSAAGRPARTYYRLTEAGIEQAPQALAAAATRTRRPRRPAVADDPFAAVDALLATVTAPVELPPPPVRLQLRKDAELTQAQVAAALGVRPRTLAAWEKGEAEPPAAVRAAYLRLLEGLADRLARTPAPPVPADPAAPAMDRDAEGNLVTAAPAPCTVCGRPTPYRRAGAPRHLGDFCRPAPPAHPAGTVPADPPTLAAPDSTGTRPAPAPEPAPAALRTPPAQPAAPRHPAPRQGAQAAHPHQPHRPHQPRPAGRAGRVRPGVDLQEMIPRAVEEELHAAQGDVQAAALALDRRAIPDAMAMFKASRAGARYEHTWYPPLPDILRKPTKDAPDQIWEARPKWRNRSLPPGIHQVTALDMNAAYLSALKVHLPIGPLEHRAGPDVDDHDGPGGRTRRRSGFYLIDPPAWDHTDLPHPLGAREEPGPLWICDPILRLLQRCATPTYGRLCAPPRILESWTAVASENICETLRTVWRDARDQALAQDDDLTLNYIKAMYAKFVSTMGQSNFNREIERPDWMHLIRAQAFANLWSKAHKAREHGLTVVRVMGTDELHVTGAWRQVFAEGRGVAEVKVKDEYPLEGPGRA